MFKLKILNGRAGRPLTCSKARLASILGENAANCLLSAYGRRRKRMTTTLPGGAVGVGGVNLWIQRAR